MGRVCSSPRPAEATRSASMLRNYSFFSDHRLLDNDSAGVRVADDQDTRALTIAGPDAR